MSAEKPAPITTRTARSYGWGEKALAAEDVPDLSKKLIESAANGFAMPFAEFEHSGKHAPTSLYRADGGERSRK